MKSLVRFLRGLARQRQAQVQKRNLLRLGAPEEISRQDWPESLQNPGDFYLKCFRYFHTRLPRVFREHREYFTQKRRGFGEDAFHVLWFLLFREFKPRTFLEIGVYRGQTISLASLLQRHWGYEGETAGISPFSSAGDSVSKYLSSVNYLEDTLANFTHFSLRRPHLLKALSTEAGAEKLIASRAWDCIYIDGNHDYEIARQDWENCSRTTARGGLIVLDDSGLTTNYQPPIFATGGHPGPSRLAQEIKAAGEFGEILQVGHNRVFQKIG